MTEFPVKNNGAIETDSNKLDTLIKVKEVHR